MLIAFILNMPGRNSWNGRWNGDDRCYAIVRSFRKPEICARILKESSYGYSFGDGWFARIDVSQVDRAKAAYLRRKSAGFSGYEWMVDEICSLGRIRTLAEQTAKAVPT